MRAKRCRANPQLHRVGFSLHKLFVGGHSQGFPYPFLTFLVLTTQYSELIPPFSAVIFCK